MIPGTTVGPLWGSEIPAGATILGGREERERQRERERQKEREVCVCVFLFLPVLEML